MSSLLDTRISADIIRAHILPRLDGPTLVAATCASSELHALSWDDDNLWRHVCTSTWPSTDDPRVRDAISGHRSLFSDSFPALQRPSRAVRSPPPSTRGLVSAVDMFYRGKPVFSRVQETETETEWFARSPFRVDLLAQKETCPIPMGRVEEGLTLSWIVIDPAMKRAANLSSRSPVSVTRHWLTGDVELRFGAILMNCKVELGVVITQGRNKEMEMEMSEVSMQVEGMDGRLLNGKDSLVILQGAVGFGERRRPQGRDHGKRSFQEYEEMKVRRRRRMQRIERALDFGCILTALTTFLTFCCYILFH